MKTNISEIEVFALEQSGYKASIMKAPRLVGDRIFGLPPGTPIGCIPIKCLPGVPENWLQRAGTYVVQIDCENGFWFDWRDNDEYNTAVISSVKGINPITGLEINELKMEQYRDKCPIHGCDFSHDNHCEKCGYSFPYQNYISYPNVPLWQDGFRQPDGSVRQFFFTEEDKRDVASAIIGKQNTIPAFGFAFYRCKNERRPVMERGRCIDELSVESVYLCDSIDGIDNNNIKGFYDNGSSGNHIPKGYYTTCSSASSSTSSNSMTLGGHNFCSSNSHIGTKGFVFKKSATRSIGSDIGADNKKFQEEKKQERFVKDVSIGAGAKIRQNLNIDLTPLEEWGQNPEAVITLYFVFSEQLEAIIEKGGIKKLESHPDGYLKDVVQVG